MNAGVAVVADAGPGAGLGHLARCSAIAAALLGRGAAVACHAHLAEHPPPPIDGIAWAPLAAPADLPAAAVLVLDTYVMPAADVEALGARCALVALHDAGDPPRGARILVGMEEPLAAPGVRVLSGLAHAPLRAPFWEPEPRAVAAQVGRILVTTGGGVLQESGAGLAALARDTVPGASVALVRGPFASFDPPPGVELVAAPASLADELRAADVVVSAAGQTALEAAATGAPCIALPLVANQAANARALARAGAAIVLEDPSDVGSALARLAADREERAALAWRAQAAVDGRGAHRIAAAIAELLAAVSSPGEAA
jgi:spore coat polysaccharide biosynthesis predicted glycosyltransferase SpsG